MKKMQFKRLLLPGFPLLILAVLLVFACGPKSSPVTDENDAIVRSYKLIDSGRAQEAVELLEPRFREHPERPSLRVALASAHAALAGIRVPRYYELVIGLLKAQVLPHADVEAEFERKFSEAGLSEDAKEGARRALKSVVVFLDLLSQFEKLPRVNQEQAVELRKGRELLEDIPERERGAILYRAVLGTVDIRFQIESEVVPKRFHRRGRECRIELREFSEDLKRVSGEVDYVVRDFSKFYPDTFGKAGTVTEALKRASALLDETLKQNGIGEDVGLPCGI